MTNNIPHPRALRKASIFARDPDDLKQLLEVLLSSAYLTPLERHFVRQCAGDYSVFGWLCPGGGDYARLTRIQRAAIDRHLVAEVR
jgi:hypothetical protein